MSGKLIGSKARSHARTKETLKWGNVQKGRLHAIVPVASGVATRSKNRVGVLTLVVAGRVVVADCEVGRDVATSVGETA